MSQIHFVHEHKPGTALDATQVRALRSHVRRVNLERSNQKITSRLENFRSLTIRDFLGKERGKIEKTKSSLSAEPGDTIFSEPEIAPEGQISTSSNSIIADTPTRAFESLSSRGSGTLPKRCECEHRDLPEYPSVFSELFSSSDATNHVNDQHPYTSRISRYVDIDERRIDQLLNSCAFQVAAAPLVPRRKTGGYPDLLANSAFLHALLYSILHSHNDWTATDESLLLKIRAIECLKVDLRRGDPHSRALSIGTILILSGVAHRSGDHDESTAHSEGLSQLLQCYRENWTPLDPEILGTIFWQDLVGTALVGDRRAFLQAEFPSIFSRSVEFGSRPQCDLPTGFEQHRDVLSDEVLSCIREIVNLQMLSTVNEEDRTRTDHKQVSIEARLVLHEQACQRFGPVAECCRLATYIVCYVSHLTPWSRAFVPLRLGEKILAHLDWTSASEVWIGRRDLFLWLLLVGASVCRGTNCFALALMPQYGRLIARIFEEAKYWDDVEDGALVVQSVLQGFLYSSDWISSRHVIPNWMALERLMLLSSTEAVAILDEQITDDLSARGSDDTYGNGKLRV